MKEKLKNILSKIYCILVRPLDTMLPFLLSMTLLTAIVAAVSPNSKQIISGNGFGNVCSFYCFGILMSMLPWKRERKILEYTIISITCLLDIVETYCNLNFGIIISPTLLQLVSQTNDSEAKGFINEYILTSVTLSLLALYCAAIALIVFFYKSKFFANIAKRLLNGTRTHHFLIIIPLVALCICCYKSPVKTEYITLILSNNIVDAELKYKSNCAYSNIQRLILAFRLSSIAKSENAELSKTVAKTTIKGCTHESPLIVLVIGESYVRNHSQLYGYKKETTPFQVSEQKKGHLFAFSNSITPNNLTATVFRNLLSTTRVADNKEWYKNTLFPRLLKLGGYQTTFISNQFVPTSYSIYDFLGDFYLNDPTISNLMFDHRNKDLKKFDGELIPELKKAIAGNVPYKFVIFHEIGMHVQFFGRYPKDQAIFKAADYNDRKGLSNSEKQKVAHYDNAVLYNDHVKEQLIKTLYNKDAIVIFLSDHGEEVFDYDHRDHRPQAIFTPQVLLSEYRIPMWIWCSKEYAKHHPNIVSRIKQSVNKPFMTDDLSHLIFDLAGINSNDFHPERSVISPNYDTHRKRMIGPNYDHDFDLIVGNRQ